MLTRHDRNSKTKAFEETFIYISVFVCSESHINTLEQRIKVDLKH